MIHSIDNEQRLYVIKESCGYSCLGFEVAQKRMERLAAEMGRKTPAAELGTEAHYQAYLDLHSAARRNLDGASKCELSPQLIGLEGYRVEVVTDYGEKRRFIDRQVYRMDADSPRNIAAVKSWRRRGGTTLPKCADAV